MASLVLLMGPTGAGKSAQCTLLEREYGWKHISTGELLRADDSTRGRLVSGNLAPAADVERLVARALSACGPDDTVLLDGFPRVVSQATWLDSHLPQWGMDLKAVIHLDVTRATSNARLALRQRSDDNPAALNRKWQAYTDRTVPVLEHYERAGMLNHVDANGAIALVHEVIKKVFTS